MSSFVIEPDYNWKSAAAQEGVDYDAVMKSFMDQSYGVVANKAKVLFQDPFRLGFEIVHRNEKATKMVGIFAFRCNQALLYAPVFFVNGEIKAADMLYRGDVKRFVPLDDDWCAFLVRGANQDGGQLVEKNRQRQPDAYMDRLAYPQRVKYASTEGVALFKELLTHCADDSPLRPLIPMAIRDGGPDTLEKLAALIEGSEIAQRFVAENYSEADLTDVSGWQEKAASAAPVDPEAHAIVYVSDPLLSKSAAERTAIMSKGYALVDNRDPSTVNVVIEELENDTVKELASPCLADVLMADGSSERALLLGESYGDFDCKPIAYLGVGSDRARRPEYVYYPGNKKLQRLRYEQKAFGDTPADETIETKGPDELAQGKVYIMVNLDSMSSSEPFHVCDRVSDGDCEVLTLRTRWSSPKQLFYAPGRQHTAEGYISDETRFLEVDAEIEWNDERNDIRSIESNCDRVLMDSAGIDRWMRTAGGITKSVDVTVKRNQDATFDIKWQDGVGQTKIARDLGMLEAHMKLAQDFELTCDKAGEILDKTADDSVSRFRIYETAEKCAYVTRMDSMQPWIQSHDPELNVRLDAPQRQVLSTHTPQRQQQQQRYGDHWDRGHFEPKGEDDDGLPDDAIFSKSPEELAQLSSQYNMPHIFDHGALSQMATSMFNTVTQIQQYIPDLETGVDRYFRILFLLRYRPADFEEAYGKDALMEMEQELSELASMAGANLLRMLKRFDINKYSGQES